MGKVFAFHGGIHPPENKKQSTREPIVKAPMPKRLIVSLGQHIGAPAKPLVAAGDHVLKGQTIAAPEGPISAAVHAPTSGTVIDISNQPIPHISGLDGLCVIIEPDGEDTWVEHQGLPDYREVSPQELVEHIRLNGVTGLGGAGFPTDIKLKLGDTHPIETLVINAAECEPYITADDMLMRERADEVISGIEVLAHILSPKRIIIGIEDNKPRAAEALYKATKQSERKIEVTVVPTKYPSGGERQLVKLLTDIEIPSGQRAAAVGILCQNVGTAVAIHRAVNLGEPLISRIVTITGDAVAHPRNLDVLIGTPFADLLEACGLHPDSLHKMVMGGPLMGIPITEPQTPVIKTTNCIIAATADEMPDAPVAQACIRCGMCEQVCPATLLPQQLYWFSRGKEFDKARHHNLFDCIECGACEFVCPSNIPLVQYYRYAKSEIRQEDAEQRKADHASARFEARQARIEREAAEKEARRKARAEAAAKAQEARKQQSASTASPAAPAAAEPDVKKLKTDAAVARTKLKKAQKALEAARESGEGDIAALEADLKAAEQKRDEAQKALDNAQSGSAAPAASTGPDLKKLKTDAAVARTKLKKAQKALDAARESGEGDIAALEADLKAAEQKRDEAQKALDEAQSGSAAPAASTGPDLKKLKTDAAVARTKLKKAQKALDAARESGEGDIAALEADLKAAEQKRDEAQKALDNAQSGSAAPAASTGPNLKKLKTDAAVARTKLKKAEEALKNAEHKGLEGIEKLRDTVAKLQSKHDDAEKAYQDALNTNASTNTLETATSPVTVDAKALKQQVSIVRTKLKKLERTYEEANDSEKAELEPQLEEMRARFAEASANLAREEKSRQEAAASEGVDLKQLKIDAAMAKAAVTKAQRTLDKADEADRSAAEQALEQAQQNASALSEKLSRYE